MAEDRWRKSGGVNGIITGRVFAGNGRLAIQWFLHLNHRIVGHASLHQKGGLVLRTATVLVIAAVCPVLVAKDKAKSGLPADVLNAHTVLVVIKPNAGEPLADPTANQRAREDVEKALMRWRRFDLALEPSTADLIIAIRKGSGKSVSPTVRGGPIDQRPVIFEPQDGNVRIGGQRGKPQDANQPNGIPQETSPRVQTEIGSSEDTFEVYRGRTEYPLDGPAVWRYIAKDGLRTPNVPSVEQFRKAIDEATNAASNKKQTP